MNIRVARFFSISILVPMLYVSSYASSQEIDFGRDVWPIFELRCIECHGPEKDEEGLRFDDLEWFTEDDLTGNGNPAKSLIYEMVTLEDNEDGYMPKKREHLSDEEIDMLRRWIEAGGKAGGWIVPTDIVVTRAPSKPRVKTHLDRLGKGLSPAPEDSLIALRKLGAVAIPVAQNSHLLRVNFELIGETIGDAQLELLAPLSEHITILGLARTKVTDVGLARLQRLRNVTHLNLGYTQISDAGLEWVATLENLETLNIINTKISDSGLKSLERLPRLRRIYAWGSTITIFGTEQIRAVIPELNIDLGIEPSKTSE